MANCWLHYTKKAKDEPTKNKKLETKEINRNNDYQNNLMLIMAPTKDEQYLQNLEQSKENFLKKVKKNNLEEVEQLIEDNFTENNQLKKEKDDWKTAWKEVQQDSKEQITKLNEQLTKKDDRLFQLEKLFKGTANIFNKQHNYVSQLKKQLELEKQAKGVSQEQAQHLQEDINRLDQEKQELDQRNKELEAKRTETEKARDKELSDLRNEKQQLKTKLQQETLSDVDKEFLKDVQKLGSAINFDSLPPLWNDILKRAGSFNGKLQPIAYCLYFRMSEVIQEHQKLKLWTDLFTIWTPEKLRKLFDFTELDYLSGMSKSQLEAAWNKLVNWRTNYGVHPLPVADITYKIIPVIYNSLFYYIKEKFWWDKWIADNRYDFIRPTSHQNYNIWDPNGNITSLSIYANRDESKKFVKEKLYPYYRDK